jgi:Mrp family chromosome partitioning ATPase
MQVADANIISRAPVPNTPNPPSRKLLILASIPCGFLLGLFIALLQERAEEGPLRIAPQPLRANAPVLARIPDLTLEGLRGATIAETLLTLPFSRFAQSIAELERRIPVDFGGSARVIGVVSPASRDGMAVMALSVARAAAQRGRKVVVIDADPGRGVARVSGSTTSLPGLPYVLSGQSALGRSLIRDPSSGAFLLSGEWGNADPDRLLGSPEMRLLLDRLRGSCDLVLLSLPYGPVAARAALTNLSDATIVLLGWGGAPQPTPAQANALASDFRNAALVYAA